MLKLQPRKQFLTWADNKLSGELMAQKIILKMVNGPCSWTPQHLVRWNRGLNHQPSAL